MENTTLVNLCTATTYVRTAIKSGLKKEVVSLERLILMDNVAFGTRESGLIREMVLLKGWSE